MEKNIYNVMKERKKEIENEMLYANDIFYKVIFRNMFFF